jgi:hypothetical protein
MKSLRIQIPKSIFRQARLLFQSIITFLFLHRIIDAHTSPILSLSFGEVYPPAACLPFFKKEEK